MRLSIQNYAEHRCGSQAKKSATLIIHTQPAFHLLPALQRIGIYHSVVETYVVFVLCALHAKFGTSRTSAMKSVHQDMLFACSNARAKS